MLLSSGRFGKKPMEAKNNEKKLRNGGKERKQYNFARSLLGKAEEMVIVVYCPVIHSRVNSSVTLGENLRKEKSRKK
jgi:hypothetical protein